MFGTGTLGNAYGVAVSAFPATEGDVYVADASDHTVKVYDPSVSLTTPVQVIDGANTAAGRFVSLADSTLAVDQSNGNLFVVDNTTPLAEHPAPPSTSSTPTACSAASSNTRSSTEHPSGSPSTNPRRPPTARST